MKNIPPYIHLGLALQEQNSEQLDSVFTSSCINRINSLLSGWKRFMLEPQMTWGFGSSELHDLLRPSPRHFPSARQRNKIGMTPPHRPPATQDALLGLSGPLRLRVQSRSRRQSTIATSIAYSFILVSRDFRDYSTNIVWLSLLSGLR